MQIHEAISEALKRHSVSARSIALAAGLADSQVSFFLSGKRGMTYEKLNTFLEALPPHIYQEFCRLLAGDAQMASVAEAIATLATAQLTDEQLASILAIASQQLRKPQSRKESEELTAIV